MSIVIGLKYKDGVILASDGQVTEKGNCIVKDVIKFCKSKYSNTALGVVGELRDLNILSTIDDFIRYKDILDKTYIDEQYIIEKVIPDIFSKLRNNNRIKLNNQIEEIMSDLLFCTYDKIFYISVDGAVVEMLDYGVIGCGKDMVMGFLDTQNLKDLSENQAIKIIEKCIQQSCNKDCYINENINYILLKKENT